jgi:hypothetical protein
MKHPRPSQVTVIPALPGIRVLLAESDGSGYCSQIVIAWSIVTSLEPDRHGAVGVPCSVLPVTVDGNNYDEVSQPWAIQQPDGTVESPVEGLFASAADWLTQVKVRVERDAAQLSPP